MALLPNLAAPRTPLASPYFGFKNTPSYSLPITNFLTSALVRKFVIGREYEGVFLKPKYGDASGVRGAARLGRSATY